MGMPKTIFVSVTKALNGEIDDVKTTTPLKDVARGWWHVNMQKAKQCELLAAVYSGTIKGVWMIDHSVGWKPMTMHSIPTRHPIDIEPNRKYCELQGMFEDDGIIGRKISSLPNVARMRGPVRYNF